MEELSAEVSSVLADLSHNIQRKITGVAPAKHFLKRKIRTWLELMKPS